MYQETGYYIDSEILILIWIAGLVISIFSLIITWRLFSKAGEAGWASLIPVYNIWVYYRVIWGSGAKMFLNLIPIYHIIFAFQTIFRTAKVFGKGTGFGFGLLFFHPIFIMILAFGNAKYVGAPGYRPADYQPVSGYGQQEGRFGGQWNFQTPVQSDGRVNPYSSPQNTTQQSPASKYCIHCGCKLDADSNFCPECGGKQS